MTAPAPRPVFPDVSEGRRGDRSGRTRRGISGVPLVAGIALAGIFVICGYAAWLVLTDLLR